MANAIENQTRAVIRTGGKQYLVQEGEELLVEKLPGKKLSLAAVAMIKAGALAAKPGKVEAEILGDEKGPKLTVFKMKSKKRSRRKAGHRQVGTRIRITKIS